MSQFLYPSACVVRVLAPAAANTTTLTGSAVDITDLDGPIMAISSAGAGSGTAPTLAGKIQDSPDGSTDWADVTAATFTGVTDAAAATQKITFNKTATRGHVRYVGTIGGDTPSFALGVLLIGMKKMS